MRTFLHKQATIDHVQTCIDLAVVDIFIGLRAKDTPLPMQQDREPLLDMWESTKRASGTARATAGGAIQRMAMESQLQRTTSNARRKGRDWQKGRKACGKDGNQEGKEQVRKDVLEEEQ
jgi:hypothetical protein